ncbi:hypothetical protein Hanom_Chr07g00607771 [Helianthus anomalus]
MISLMLFSKLSSLCFTSNNCRLDVSASPSVSFIFFASSTCLFSNSCITLTNILTREPHKHMYAVHIRLRDISEALKHHLMSSSS